MFKKHLLTTNLIKLNKLYEKITISLNVNHWIFFLTTFLIGCFRMQKMEVRPKSLPNATLGNPYYAKIEVFGGHANRHDFYYDIQPEKSGLELSPRGLGTEHVSYNNIEVKGIPKIAGTITIELFGGTYGTNTCPGKPYNKVYTIKVEE